MNDQAHQYDVAFLRAVCNWAVARRLVQHSPIAGVEYPTTPSPARPIATYDRYLKLKAKASEVDALFPLFLDLIEGLGWRVSAIRQLRRGDIGLDARRILKSWQTDKENVEQWVPVPDALQSKLREVMGPASEYVFPAPKDRAKPWSRYYARQLLRRCEKLAGVEPLKGGQWHPFRRKWVTERKHLPMADVAAAGGWRSVRTLDIYAQPDEKTILAVVNEPNKLWEVK